MGVYLYTARKNNRIQAETPDGDKVAITRMVYDWKPWFRTGMDKPMYLAMGRAERAFPDGLQEELVVEAEKEGLPYDGAPVYRRTGTAHWFDTDRLGERVGTLRVEGNQVHLVPTEEAQA